MTSTIHLPGIFERWQAAAMPTAERVLVASPYITGAALAIFSKVPPGSAEIYKVFSAENFATKASSLSTVRRLLQLGHKVFHLPKLHAKVFLIPGTFASVGSQNLTNGGRYNQEASVELVDPESMAFLVKAFETWAQNRLEVTIEMVNELSLRLSPVRHEFESALQAAEALDEEIVAAEKARTAARQEAERKAQEDARRKGEQLMQKTLSRAKTSNESAYTVIKSASRESRRISLVSEYGRLDRWTVGETVHSLQRGYRYLCIVPHMEKVGWARVFTTRITFIENYHFCTLKIGRHILHASFKAIWDAQDRPMNGSNLRVTMRDSWTQQAAEFGIYFSGEGIEVRHAVAGPVGDVVAKIPSSHPQAFSREVLNAVLPPFKYASNATGDDAHQFFSQPGQSNSRRVQLKLLGVHPVLIATTI